MHVWSVATGELETKFFAKRHDGWQPQWTDDEATCARTVTNELQFYDGKDLKSGVKTRAILKNIAHFKLAPGGGPCKFAAFIPGVKVR